MAKLIQFESEGESLYPVIDQRIVRLTAYGSGASGLVEYMRTGKLVTVQGTINTSASFASGATLISGLPVPDNAHNVGTFATNNNTANSRYRVFTGDGLLRTGEAIPSGVSLRFALTYIEAQ